VWLVVFLVSDHQYYIQIKGAGTYVKVLEQLRLFLAHIVVRLKGAVDDILSLH